jgi:hypothetical protein
LRNAAGDEALAVFIDKVVVNEPAAMCQWLCDSVASGKSKVPAVHATGNLGVE